METFECSECGKELEAETKPEIEVVCDECVYEVLFEIRKDLDKLGY